MYIVIEGQDGTGKSTEARLLAKYLETKGKEVIIIDEPDGDIESAHDIHDLILIRGKKYHLEPETNVALFTASRIELWNKIVDPALTAGKAVISARNYWSTLAYQGYGEGVSIEKITNITKAMLPARYCNPDKSVILTVPDEIRLSRQGVRGKDTETFEEKNDDFQQRVNSAYPIIAQKFNIPILDASGTMEKVQNDLIKLFGL